MKKQAIKCRDALNASFPIERRDALNASFIMKRHIQCVSTGIIMALVSSSLAHAAEPAPAAGPLGSLGAFLPMILIFAVFYFLMIRPQQKQAKKRQETINALKRGDRVLLNSGIIGKIFTMTDQVFTIEVADNVRIRVLRSAVQDVVDEAMLTGEGKKE